MSYYFPSVDPIYLLKREGTDNDPFLFLIDKGNVTNSFYVLREIPSHTLGVKVFDGNTEMTETDNDAPSSGQYRVDYSVGIIHFHSSMNGKQITTEYHGMGFVNIPTTRIQMPGESGDPIETLQNALDRVDDAISVLGEVGDLDFKGEYNITTSYKKWNFVTYDNKTFVAVQNSIGVIPTETTHWRLVSSGVGASGVFDPDTSYTIGDIVSDMGRKNVYVSKAIDNNSPLSDVSKWELILTLDDTIESLTTLIDNKIDELNLLKDQLEASDSQRDENDLNRDNLLNDALVNMNTVMESHSINENTRDENEIERKFEENRRISAENVRVANESLRETNEVTRKSQEATREQLFNNVLSENQLLVDSVQNGLSTISDKVTEVDMVIDDVDLVLTNVEFALEHMSDFVHMGDHDMMQDYKQYNIVNHDGSSYIAIQEILAENTISIEDHNYWRLLARKGKDGTEITIGGVSADENNNIDLESLGYATENQIINMRDEVLDETDATIGNLNELQTVNKVNVVGAINELKRKIDDLIDVIT